MNALPLTRILLTMLGALLVHGELEAAEVDSVTVGDFDLKVAPGISCLPGNPDNAGLSRNGVLTNNSTTTNLDVICPVVDDRQGLFRIIPVIGAFRATGAAAMNCFVVFRTDAGVVSTISQPVNTTGALFQVNFGLLTPTPNTVSATIGCRLPPKVSGRASSISFWAYVEL